MEERSDEAISSVTRLPRPDKSGLAMTGELLSNLFLILKVNEREIARIKLLNLYLF